jgi:hypothetical protein
MLWKALSAEGEAWKGWKEARGRRKREGEGRRKGEGGGKGGRKKGWEGKGKEKHNLARKPA